MSGDQYKAQQAQEEFFNLYNSENAQAGWKLTQYVYNQGDEFYNKLNNDLSTIDSIIDKANKYYKIRSRAQAKQRDMEKDLGSQPIITEAEGEEIVDKKMNEVIKKAKHLETCRDIMKEVLKKINGKKLAKLKVEKNPILLELFQTLFDIFYQPKNMVFDWEKFSTFAFVKNKCDEFILKLVPPTFTELTDNQIEQLIKIKDDPKLEKFLQEDKGGEQLLHIIDYLEYLPDTVQTQREVNKLKSELADTKREVFMRNVITEYHISQTKTMDEHMKNLQDLHQRFSDTLLGLQGALKGINEASNLFNGRKQSVPSSITEKVNELLPLPKSLFKE